MKLLRLSAAIVAILCAASPALIAAAPTSGLVGYWSFDDGSLTETSGFKPAGTHEGVPVGNVAFINGPAGKALDLTANNTAVKISNSNVNDPGYQVRRHGGDNVGTFTLRSSDGEDDPFNASGISFNDGSWHHVAGVYDPATGQRFLYVDGTEEFVIPAGNLDPASAPGQSLVFGARNEDAASGVLTAFSPVALDEVRIYQRALSAQEVAGMYTPGIQVVPGSLVAYTPRGGHERSADHRAGFPPGEQCGGRGGDQPESDGGGAGRGR